MKALFILLTILSSQIIQAQSFRGSENSQPLYEIGAGSVYGVVPHYPGSDEHTALLVPFPSVIYRGDRLRADEDGGVRTRFFYSESFEINLSIGGSLPVSSKDNDEREGMEKLHTIAEFGPGLIYHFYNKRNHDKLRFAINVPVRMAISTNIKDTYRRGYVFNPILFSFYELSSSFTIFGSLSGRWATKEYHDYLYTVGVKDVNDNRPRYEATKGYVLSTYGLALIYNTKKATIFSGFSYDDATNNANRNSPLFVKKSSYSFAIGFTWYFYKSKKMVN